MSRNIYSNFVYSMFDKFIRMGLSFFIVALMARNLSKNDFGILNYSLTVSSLMITLTWLISADLIVKTLSENKHKESVVISTTFWGRLIASIILTIVMISYAHINYSGSDFFVLVIFSSSILLNPLSVIHSYFRYKTDLKKIIQYDLISYLITSSIKILVVWYYHDIIILAAIYALEYLFSAFIFIILYKKNNKRIEFYFNYTLFKSLAKLGLPILLGTSINVLFLKVDRLMITSFLGPEKLADYYVATNLTEVWWSIPIIFIQIASSKLLYQVDDLKENYRDINKLISVFFIVLCSALYMVSEDLILLVYGQEYIASSDILKIYLISSIFVFWDYLNNQIFIKNNKTKLILWKSIFGLVINVILNYLLINKLGIVGAAIGTLISYFCSWLFILVIDKDMREMCIIQIKCLFNPMFNPINLSEKLKSNDF